MTTALWWIRRDLRLTDNPTLDIALAQADEVVPVFVLDPFFERSPYVGEKRLAFLLAGLRALDASLRERGSHLIVRQGQPADALAELVEQTGAEMVYAQEDFSPYARRRDASVGEHVPLTLTGGLTAHPPEAITKSNGTAYLVYSPYAEKWRALPQPRLGDLLPTPERITTREGLASDPIPDEPALPTDAPFRPGEDEAQRRLREFSSGQDALIYRFDKARNRLDWDASSRLSPYLRFGMLSARQAVAATYAALDDAPTEQDYDNALQFLRELIWREFFIMVMYHHPRVRRENFREKYDAVEWLDDRAAFEAWQEGRTGYPAVDASMRQLRTTGWINNRARMIVGSFLVKHLFINWQWGERWFMQQLVDGDPAANNGNWQWVAGTGVDAQPYFRIFNPVSQAEKHDPRGEFIRQWIPSLQDVPDDYIHRPEEMPDGVQREAGCIIGQDYPAPIVEHEAARKRALARYRAATKKSK